MLKQLESAYKHIDLNGDGSFTRNELDKALQRHHLLGPQLGIYKSTGRMDKDSQAEAQGLVEVGDAFKQMDRNRNEAIDLQDFISFFKRKHDADKEQRQLRREAILIISTALKWLCRDKEPVLQSLPALTIFCAHLYTQQDVDTDRTLQFEDVPHFADTSEERERLYNIYKAQFGSCLLYTSPSPRDRG